MSLIRKAIIFAAVTIIASGSSYALGRTGLNLGRAITQSRCSSGAFLDHSTAAGAVAADSTASDTVASQGGPAKISAPDQNIKALGDNLVPDANLENINSNGTAPAAPWDWLNNIYGKNNAVFSLVDGHNSDHAVRTSITNYANGDADWYSSTVSVVPGQYYRYQDYYRSDTSSRAVLMLEDTAGQTQYINLQSTGPTSNWALYQTTFFIPQNVTKAMVFHPLAAKGFLDLDDSSLVPVQAQGFSRPIVTLTFDDGWRSIHDNALPLMQRYGVVSTDYIITGYVGQAKDYVTPSQIYDLRGSGNEIASHTVDHQDLTKLSIAAANAELQRSSQDLAKCYGQPTDFAPPYGTYNAATTQQAQKYYQTARSTDAGFNTADNLNPYGLLVQNMTADTTTAQLNAWLETARQNHAWLILVYHQVDSSQSSFARHPADFEHDLQAVKTSGITIETMNQAYNEVKPQVAK